MPSAAERKLEKKIRDLEQDIKKMNKSSSSSSSSRSKKKSSPRSKKKSSSPKSEKYGVYRRVPRDPRAIRLIGNQPPSTSRSPAWKAVDKKDDRGPGKFQDGVRVRDNMNIDALREVDEANEAWNNPAPGRNPREIFFDPQWAKEQGVVRTGKSPKKKKTPKIGRKV